MGQYSPESPYKSEELCMACACGMSRVLVPRYTVLSCVVCTRAAELREYTYNLQNKRTVHAGAVRSTVRYALPRYDPTPMKILHMYRCAHRYSTNLFFWSSVTLRILPYTCCSVRLSPCTAVSRDDPRDRSMRTSECGTDSRFWTGKVTTTAVRGHTYTSCECEGTHE